MKTAAVAHQMPQDIPRTGLIWLLLAQVLVIIPHVLHVPLWLLGLWLVCAVWRVQVLRMRLSFPNSWVKAGLMLGCGFAVYLSRAAWLGWMQRWPY